MTAVLKVPNYLIGQPWVYRYQFNCYVSITLTLKNRGSLNN